MPHDDETPRDRRVAAGRPVTDEMRHASATLFRGAAFLGACLRAPIAHDAESGSLAIEGRYRAKVIGNGLRELDRFLNLLIDAASAARGLPVRPGQHNTANKLAAYRAAISLPHHDDMRLRALGRSRDCLFYCGGRVRRGDRRGGVTMTIGWPERPGHDAPLRRVIVGQELTVTRGDLDDVCRFYRRIALDLCGIDSAAPRIDLTPSPAFAGARAERMPIAASR